MRRLTVEHFVKKTVKLMTKSTSKPMILESDNPGQKASAN